MFGLIRLLLGCVLFGCAVLIIRKRKVFKKRNLYIIATLITIFFVVISTLIPFENIFVTFSSPESAYRYVSYGNADIKLIVDGQYSDFIICSQSGSDVCLIVPKTIDGWKLGIGINTKIILQRFVNGVVIYVYQYKNTSDFFITILDTQGGTTEIFDSYNSHFLSLEQVNNPTGEIFVTYYANIPNLNQQYWLNVNGDIISIFGMDDSLTS